ncbi:MAG: chemotaxis protein CheW [Planctomycetaceae bacterium]
MTRSSPFDACIPSPDFTIANRSDLPILGEANRSKLENDCWNQIGVTGDRSCPELQKHVHCRNCPVFTAAGQRLFEREPPAVYLAEWTKRLAEPEVVAERDTISVLIFRVGEEWLAFDIGLLVEIAEPRPIHTLPQRSNEILAGLVNIRGELELCVSLGGLLGIEPNALASGVRNALASGRRQTEPNALASGVSDVGLFQDGVFQGASSIRGPRLAPSAHSAQRVTARLMLVSREGQRWVLQVDEVEGVARFTPAEVTNVPATVSGSAASFSKSVFWHRDRRIGFLDEARIFDSLERSLT